MNIPHTLYKSQILWIFHECEVLTRSCAGIICFRLTEPHSADSAGWSAAWPNTTVQFPGTTLPHKSSPLAHTSSAFTTTLSIAPQEDNGRRNNVWTCQRDIRRFRSPFTNFRGPNSQDQLGLVTTKVLGMFIGPFNYIMHVCQWWGGGSIRTGHFEPAIRIVYV